MAEKRPEWKDSKYADAKGRFKKLNCGDLATWLIKSRKGNKKAIVFNRQKNPSYAAKMKCARNKAMKKLGNGKK